MRRTDLQDTALWLHRAKIERLRAMTPEQRLRQLFDRIEAGRQIEKLARERRSQS